MPEGERGLAFLPPSGGEVREMISIQSTGLLGFSESRDFLKHLVFLGLMSIVSFLNGMPSISYRKVLVHYKIIRNFLKL